MKRKCVTFHGGTPKPLKRFSVVLFYTRVLFQVHRSKITLRSDMPIRSGPLKPSRTLGHVSRNSIPIVVGSPKRVLGLYVAFIRVYM